MRKKIVLTAAVWTAVTFSFLFLFLGRSSAEAEPKNYYFPEIRIEINIERAVAPVWYSGFNRATFISTGRISSMINSIESMSTSIQHASISAAHYSSGEAEDSAAVGEAAVAAAVPAR
jgi:hypothetical protein